MVPMLTYLLLLASSSRTALAAGSLLSSLNCSSLPPLTHPAKNVHELRPQDIKVVMALGDSITAGFGIMGAHHGIHDFDEYRGQSWSMGGDPNSSTIAAFLRHYNPDLIGSSLGAHFVELCYGPLCPPFQYYPDKDVFNAAQTAAMMPNLVTHEFDYLIYQLQKNPHVDMKLDWKLLTILVGFNDLCLGCSGDVPFLTPDDFENNLRDTLEKVHAKIPRVFVNLVEVFNVSLVYVKSKESKYCEDVHHILPIECLCDFISGEEGDKTRKEMDTTAQLYNERMRIVAYEYSQRNYNDFAVVVQPGLRDGRPETTPLSFLSTLDCFHPSLVGHQAMAKVIWNNMLSPQAKKTTTFDWEAPFICPDNSTLLYTK